MVVDSQTINKVVFGDFCPRLLHYEGKDDSHRKAPLLTHDTETDAMEMVGETLSACPPPAAVVLTFFCNTATHQTVISLWLTPRFGPVAEHSCSRQLHQVRHQAHVQD